MIWVCWTGIIAAASTIAWVWGYRVGVNIERNDPKLPEPYNR